MAPPPNFALTERFSWEAFCSNQQEVDWKTQLSHASSQQFMTNLGLSTVYPACLSRNFTSSAPIMGPLEVYEYHETTWDALVTLGTQVLPVLWAMSELWLRLFAAALAPIGIIVLLRVLLLRSKDEKDNSLTIPSRRRRRLVPCWPTMLGIISIASGIVLATDTLYVYQFGHEPGLYVLLLSSLLLALFSIRDKAYETLAALVSLWILFVALIFKPTQDSLVDFGDSDMIPTNVPEGVYYNTENEELDRAMKAWPVQKRTYSIENGATPWMPTGDSRTGIPFLVNNLEELELERVWLPTLDGEEAVRLEVTFPPTGHDPSKTVYLILHGLNGGTTEGFVQDFAHRRNNEGHTVVVMIARGLMDTPIVGWDVFHGARTVDAHAASKVLKERVVGPNGTLAGIGYSMGAIVLANYAARYGEDCALDVIVPISGGLDMRPKEFVGRAKRLWEPMIATTLRDQWVVGKFGERIRRRLSIGQMLELMRSKDIAMVDRHAIVTYNGFDDLQHYYAEMGAMGDIPVNANETSGRILSVTVPVCMISALDDPVLSWKTVVANEGHRHPAELVKVSPNLVFLLTKGGGHVGWPMGWFPWEHKWEWMNNAAHSFVEAVVATRERQLVGALPHGKHLESERTFCDSRMQTSRDR